MKSKIRFRPRTRTILLSGGLLLLLGVLLLPQEALTANFSHSTKDGSALTGSLSALAQLTDAQGQVVWSQTDEDSLFGPQAIVDPQTGAEVSTFLMGAAFQAKGTDIAWSTLQIHCLFYFWSYAGAGGGREYRRQLQEQLVTPTVDTGTGTATKKILFDAVSLESLMPDVLTVSYQVLDDSGRKVFVTEEYPQKTSEPHPMTFQFLARYTATVQDNYGNNFNDTFTQMATLTLMWQGSSFTIEWSEPEPTQQLPDAPTLSQHPDTSAQTEKLLNLVWQASSAIPKTYSISIDDTVVSSGPWNGGDLSYAWLPKTTGKHTIVATVEDTAGRTATDSFVVDVYLTVKEGNLDPVPPDKSVDATVQITTGETVPTSSSTGTGTLAQSFLGGVISSGNNGNRPLLLLALAVLGIILWKNGTLKKLERKIRRLV